MSPVTAAAAYLMSEGCACAARMWYDRHLTMHDAGYKRLFAQPHTVQGLSRG